MSFVGETQSQFETLSQFCFSQLQAEEEVSLNLVGEQSDFIRFNGGKIRQVTHVEIKEISLRFQSQGCSLSFGFNMTGQVENDSVIISGLLSRAREEAQVLPKDPYMVAMENRGESSQIFEGDYPSTKELIERIGNKLKGTDYAGLLTTGPVIRANSNSKGQRHWFSTDVFAFDYSIYLVNAEKQNKAVKGMYTGQKWSDKTWGAIADNSLSQLAPLQRTNKKLTVGDYRVYLAPSAVNEISGLFYWESLSFSSFKQGRSPLAKAANKEVSFSPHFHLRENFDLGFAPRFNSLGEVSKNQVDLINDGSIQQFLTSSRSAKEFSVEGNAADSSEMPRTLEIMSGNLVEKDILKTLGTGVYIGNLHYLNWSDQATARITGMTRYACFWVENGELQAPIYDMRFDESLYRIFGSELESLTQNSEANIWTESYARRNVGGYKTPGAILKNFRFTL